MKDDPQILDNDNQEPFEKDNLYFYHYLIIGVQIAAILFNILLPKYFFYFLIISLLGGIIMVYLDTQKWIKWLSVSLTIYFVTLIVMSAWDTLISLLHIKNII